MLRSDFPISKDDSTYIEIAIYWGIKDSDKSDVNKYDVSDKGDIIYDEGFDITSELNQVRMLEICE